MALYFVYDLPLWVFGVGTVAVFVVLSVVGLLATRRPIARLVGPPPGANDVASYYFAAIGVFYGLTVGLIAVST